MDTVLKEQVARYWSLLCASIIHRKRDPLFTTVTPTKLFECTATGIPALHGVERESTEFVTGHNVEAVFPSQDLNVFVAALRHSATNTPLREWLNANGSVAARRFSRDTLAAIMLANLYRVVERPEEVAHGAR